MRSDALATVALTAVVLLVAACGGGDPTATPNPPTPTASRDLFPTLGEPFEMRIGNSVFIDAEGYRIDFTDVVSDSRCAVGVECVTAGRAVIELSIREAAAVPDALHLLAIGDAGPEPTAVDVGPYNIALEALAPQPHADGRELDYVATLVVTQD